MKGFLVFLFVLMILHVLPQALTSAPLKAATLCEGSEVKAFNVPAGPLDAALDRFARTAGISLLYDPTLVAGKISKGLIGNYSIAAGLNALLVGSGIEAMAKPDGGYSLRKAAPAAIANPTEPEAAKLVLPEVWVIGRREPGLVRKDIETVLGDKPILDTPFTVSAYGRELIERQGAQTAIQLLRNDPAVTTMPAAGAVSAFGVGLRGFPAGAGSISFDGLGPGIVFAGGRGQLFSIEQVEVIKGPTAALTGFNPFAAVGGHINVVPKRPLDEPLTRVRFGLATECLKTLHADISRRFGVGEQFGIRINAATERGERFYDGTAETNVLDLAYQWRAAENLVFSGSFNYTYGSYKGYQNPFAIRPDVAIPPPPSARLNLMQPWVRFCQDLRYGYLRGDWGFAPDWTLTGQWAQGRARRGPFISPAAPIIENVAGDFTILPFYVPAGAGFPDFDAQNLIIRGNLTTGTIRHKITAGFTRNAFDQVGGFFPMRPPAFGPYTSNLYRPIHYPAPTLPVAVPIGRERVAEAEGFVLANNIVFNDRWSALLAARRARLSVQTFRVVDGILTRDYTKSKTTPLLALSYRPTPKSIVYISYAQGLEMGGVAPIGTTNARQQMPPIETEQFEIGYKHKLPAGALLTVAYFDISRALEFSRVPAVGLPTFVQDGEQRHRGLELSIGGKVLPDLTLVGGMLLLHPEIVDNSNPLHAGKQPPGVPRITLPLWAEWQVPGMVGLSLSAGIIHFGSQFVDLVNVREIPAWTRFDIGARFATRVKGLDTAFTVNIENVADLRYWASAPGGNLALGVPRTVKTALSFEF